MALNCAKKDRIFTFNGKEYSYNEFRALMYDGLMERVPELTSVAKETLATEEGKAKVEQAVPKGAVDASDVDAMQGLMERHEGSNESGISKQKLIGKVVNALRFLKNNNFAYDPETGKGTRIFITENNDAQKRAVGEAVGRDVEADDGNIITRYDDNGNLLGSDIYINLDSASENVVGHEMAHAVLVELFGQNPKLFKEFVNVLKQSISKSELDALNKFISAYEGTDVQAEEFLAELTGIIENMFASGKIEAKELSALRKLANAIKEFINKHTGGLVFEIEKESDVRAFFNALGGAIASGKDTKAKLFEMAATLSAKYENNIAQESGKIETGSAVYAGKAGNIAKSSKKENPYRESVNLPVRSLESLLKEYGDNVIVVNSDPTGLGVVTLPSGEKITLDGGIGYMAIEENINAGVGFASSSEGRVSAMYKLARNLRDAGKLKDGKVLVLVMVQKPESMLGNNYTPVYVADALSKIPQSAITKEKLSSLLIDPLNKETFVSLFYKQKKAPKQEKYKYNESKSREENKKIEEKQAKQYANKIKEVNKENKENRDAAIEKIEKIKNEIAAIDPRTAHDEMVRIFGELSFVQAQKYFDSILGSYTNKTTNYKLEISKLLYEYAEADQKNLFKVLGEESLVDALIKDPKSWGYAVAAFLHDTSKQNQKLGGIKHNLFNSKFQGDERWILDKAYRVNDIMAEFNQQQIEKAESGAAKGVQFAEQQTSQGLYPSGRATVPKDGGVIFESLKKTEKRYEGIGKIDLKASKKTHKETGFISVPSMIEIVASNDPTYLGDVIEHIFTMGEKLLKGDVGIEDLAKSYMMAISSIRAKARPVDAFGKAIDMDIPAHFIEPGMLIRPEGAMAFLLTTERGKKMLQNIKNGKLSQADADFVARAMKPFGMFSEGESKHRNLFGIPAKGQINLRNIGEFQSLLKGGVKDTEQLLNATALLKGISLNKSGFVGNFIGIGTRGVIDAREIQGWLRGVVFRGQRTSMEAAIEKELNKPGKELSPLKKEILERMRLVGEAFGLDPAVAAYVGHHMIWDAVAGEKTTHDGLYLAMTQNEDEFNAKLEKIEARDKPKVILKSSRRPTAAESESIKSGVNFVFSQPWSKVGSIGTKEQYEEYLSEVFPNSADKNVYYNGGAKDVFSAKDWNYGGNAGGVAFGDAIYLAEDRLKAKDYAERYKGIVLAAIINVQNPAFTDLRGSMGLGNDFSTSAKILGNEKADAIYGLEYVDNKNWSVSPTGVSTYVGPKDNAGMPARQEVHNREAGRQQVAIEDKSKVLILGSDEDLAGFSAFVDSKSPILKSSKKSKKELPPTTPEDTRNIITVARRRLEKIQGDPARAEERDAIFGYEGAYRNDQEYSLAIDQGRDYVAELYFKYADLPPVEWAKAVYADVQSVTNEVSKVVAYGELHAALDMYAGSKKLSAKARKEIANLRAKMVMDMAIRARRMGQANAALNEVYSQYGKFAQLVIAQKIDLEFKGKLESKEGSEKGKTIADDIQQAKEDVEEFLDKDENKEIKEVVDLAEDVNDTMEDIHAAKVAAGKSTPLDAPTPVSASELVGDPKIYDEIITELEDEIKRLDGLLAGVNKLYSSAAANAASYAQQVADLSKEINSKNRLIGKLKKQKEKIAVERDTYKKQAAALEKKVQDLKSVNKLLAKSKLSPKQKASLIAKLTQLAGAGKLNDPDFDSVFAAITGGNYLTTQDRKAIEHMAKAMEYFAGLRYRIDDKSAIPAQKEMGEKYAKRLNQYLEQVSREPKNAQKWMMIFQSWFYNAVLSGISTLQNAFVGSILTGIPNAVMNSIAMSAKNPRTAIGANVYGMMRMLKEMPTAFSKGMFNQSAYDSMGTSWTVESASTYADPFEVHILNGFFKQWDRVKNDPTALGKTKGALMLLASASAQATRVTALLKFIDPVLRHSLAAHMEGMQDYIKLKNEMRGMIKEGTADPSIIEAWTPFISKKLFNKIDEMAGVAMKDRTEAAKEAQEEINQMESDGVSIPADYLRRRTSEIMRAKRDADMTNAIDQMSADMIMMWRPDGVLGYVWDKSSKKMAIRESDSFVSALGKLALNLSILPFLRITAQGVSEIQSTIPIIGLAAAKYGLAKKANGEWKWGSRTNNAENSEFASMQVGRRVALNVLSTMIIAGLFMDTFEVEDADDDDEAEDVYDLFGKKVRIKMEPNRLFDFTSDARGSKSKNEGISEGRSNFSIRFRFGKDDEWSDWTSVRLSPHMTIPVAWLGRISDDVNKLYAEPVIGRGRIPKKAAFYEYFTDSPLTAMGEVSFATIPRLWSTFKYDAGAGFARMFMSPVAAIAQPAIYRDVIGTAASMAGATKKGEYMPEGFIGTSRALFSNIYGLNHVVSNEMTDEYGLPFESIDPIRNFWKNYTSIDERSDDYPEVNLRWKYANTFIAATPRAQRVEKVKRILVKGESLAGRSAEIELTKDEQYKSSLLTKAIYRNRVLQEYDNIIASAEQQKKTSGKNAAAAQSVEEQLNKAHRFAIGQSERAFATYKSGYIKIDTIVKTIESLNAKSKELSDKIKSKGLGPAAQDIEMYERRKK